jgi:hypothetical protein
MKLDKLSSSCTGSAGAEWNPLSGGIAKDSQKNKNAKKKLAVYVDRTHDLQIPIDMIDGKKL